MLYVRAASAPTTSMPLTKLWIRALSSRNVPYSRKTRKSATYSLISSLPCNSMRSWSNWPSASSRGCPVNHGAVAAVASVLRQFTERQVAAGPTAFQTATSFGSTSVRPPE